MSYIHPACKYEYHNGCQGYVLNAKSKSAKDPLKITCVCKCHEDTNK